MWICPPCRTSSFELIGGPEVSLSFAPRVRAYVDGAPCCKEIQQLILQKKKQYHRRESACGESSSHEGNDNSFLALDVFCTAASAETEALMAKYSSEEMKKQTAESDTLISQE
eukprot:3385539-Amphidinium_carterae.1